jgi:thioredoxin 1
MGGRINKKTMTEVTSEQLEELKKEGKNILLDLYGLWCGPCKLLMPKLELLEEQYSNVVFVKMDVDRNVDYAVDMGIRSVPTVIFYKGEELINRSSGANSESFYKDILKTL